MKIPQVQFLEKVVDVPVVCDVRCLFETVQKTAEVLQLRSWTRWTMSLLCRSSFGSREH